MFDIGLKGFVNLALFASLLSVLTFSLTLLSLTCSTQQLLTLGQDTFDLDGF